MCDAQSLNEEPGTIELFTRYAAPQRALALMYGALINRPCIGLVASMAEEAPALQVILSGGEGETRGLQ